MRRSQRVAVVMPAFNAEKTLQRTLDDIPREWIDDIILVDDASRDRTAELARELGIFTRVHGRNRGYGANQKTCYRTALERGADHVVMVHPDHQYDPAAIPTMVTPLLEGRADAVFGSRMLGGDPLGGGMPRWKYNANILLTAFANIAFGIFLTEYHSGFRAYSRQFLESVPFESNSDGFVFDTQIIAQSMALGLRIHEIPIDTRYFPEASQISFWPSVRYGLEVVRTCIGFRLLRAGLHRSRIYRVPATSGSEPV
jgi:glycosyltransferase involved in cell wall biosynthesis